jgi:flavoprotein
MKYNIDLEPVYQCKKCESLINQTDILITKTDEVNILHCPVCGCCSLSLIEIE